MEPWTDRGPVATSATVLGVSVTAHCCLDCLSTQCQERGLTDSQTIGTGHKRGEGEKKRRGKGKILEERRGEWTHNIREEERT